jgi:hypothetical protein
MIIAAGRWSTLRHISAAESPAAVQVSPRLGDLVRTVAIADGGGIAEKVSIIRKGSPLLDLSCG